MDMERERRNPSAADVPHSAKVIRGMDAERPKAKALSFDEMRSHVGFRKGEKRRSARVRTAFARWTASALRIESDARNNVGSRLKPNNRPSAQGTR